MRKISFGSVLLASAVLTWGCSPGGSSGTGTGGSTGSGGSNNGTGGAETGSGSGGTGTGGGTDGTGGTSAGTGGASAGTGGATDGTGGGSSGSGGVTGGTGGASAGTGGVSGGTGGVSGGVTGGTGGAGTATGGVSGGSGGMTGGSGGAGTGTGGVSGGTGGVAGGTGGAATPASVLVTSASGSYWKTGTWTEVTSGTATVTVNDATTAQTWEGFGGAFNEIGWNVLTSSAMQTQAVNLLFSATDGAAFTWGRIPMGASDYATSRYTLDDTGTDVTPNSGETNRPPADTSLAMFSLSRDGQKLIPYIKAAQAVNPNIRFWASPWTPPVWMKTGYKTDAAGSGTAKKASYFDGGNMANNAANLQAYAQYYVKFVQGYKQMGINIEMVSPQNEPGYDQNYPSCLWDKTTYTSWIGQYLGPAMKSLSVKVMLGTLSNAGDGGRTDLDISSAVLADATAKGFLSVVGVQWGVLEKVNGGQTFSGLPIWATEHRCGNYPWNPSTGCGETSDKCPTYNSSQAPNDQAYGVESWKYIRNAITKGKVTAYSAWNMVLDKTGLGNDTSRDWKQDALLVADGGSVTATPAYYVFRHFSQYVVPGAKVVGVSGGDSVAFKNPDGSIVAVMYNSGSANNSYIVSIGGKRFQFAMPGNGWATVKYKP